MDLERVTGLYAGTFADAAEPSALSAPVSESIAALVRDKLPQTLTWSPAAAQAAILAAIMLTPQFAEVRLHCWRSHCRIVWGELLHACYKASGQQVAFVWFRRQWSLCA